MTLGEFRKETESLPDDMEMIVQKDSEGYNYSPLSCADPDSVYIEENSYCGEVYSMCWSSEDAGMTEDEWGTLKERPRALILAPVN